MPRGFCTRGAEIVPKVRLLVVTHVAALSPPPHWCQNAGSAASVWRSPLLRVWRAAAVAFAFAPASVVHALWRYSIGPNIPTHHLHFLFLSPMPSPSPTPSCPSPPVPAV